MENKRYYIELEVLTPLSVGAGNENDWLCGVDYVQKDGKVYVIDMEKASRLGIDVERLASAFARSDQQAIISLLGSRLKKASRRIYESPAQTKNPIKAFLRTQLLDKPVVPGSSIKGAVRSCLFNDFHGHKRPNEDFMNINDNVFGTMKEGDVFTRFIHIGDIVMSQTRLINTKLFNLQGKGNDWDGGWKHSGKNTTSHYQSTGFNTLYECVEPGKMGVGAIDMMNGAFELMCKHIHAQKYLDKKQHLMQGGINSLFHIINNTTKNYLKKEREFFEAYYADRVDEIIDSIDDILNKIPDDDSYCVMKMSAGVGFHSITGDWQYDDYCDEPGLWPDNDRRNAGKKRYKSRKIAEYNGKLQLMGFVILRSIDEAGEACYHEHLERMSISDAQLKAEAEVQAQRQREEEAKRQREDAAKRRELENKYDGIMQEAKQLAEAKKWDEAIAKADEANALIPGLKEYTDWVDLWKRQKAIPGTPTGGIRYEQPLVNVLKPTSLGNVIGTTKRWVEQNGGVDTFGEAELQTLISALKALPPKEIKQLERKRKDIIKAIGEIWAARLLESFK